MATTIIHNGTCPICAREVAQYARAADRAGVALDIQGLDGPARERAGLSRDAAARRFHVIRDGRLLSGLDAFLVIWEKLPRLRWLARALRPRWVRALADPLYDHVLAPALYALHRRRVRRAAAS
jgi:predicted DCC family thiol-disulfide oxidoreductase YuxK